LVTTKSETMTRLEESVTGLQWQTVNGYSLPHWSFSVFQSPDDPMIIKDTQSRAGMLVITAHRPQYCITTVSDDN